MARPVSEDEARRIKAELMGLNPIPMVAPRRSKNPAEWPVHYTDELARRLRRRRSWIPSRRRDSYEACLRLIEWREHDLGYAVYVPPLEEAIRDDDSMDGLSAPNVNEVWASSPSGRAVMGAGGCTVAYPTVTGAVGVTGATGPSPQYTTGATGIVRAFHATGPTGPSVYPTPILVAGAGGGAAGPVGVLKPPAVEVVDLVGMDGTRFIVPRNAG